MDDEVEQKSEGEEQLKDFPKSQDVVYKIRSTYAKHLDTDRILGIFQNHNINCIVTYDTKNVNVWQK